MSAGTRGLHFTPSMIRDQEMLVSSMSQQGISEDLIKRQFERLLEEQSKQLRLSKGEPATDKTDPEKVVEIKKCKKVEVDNRESNNIPSELGSFVTCAYNVLANEAESCKISRVTSVQETANESPQPSPVPEDKLEKRHPTSNSVENVCPPKIESKIEPSSLLKIRLKKEALNSSKRNNGLQESATALKIIKDSKSKIDQDRLSSEVEGLLKLNGTQERTLGEQVQQLHYNHITQGDTLYNKTENQGKIIISANGLKNSRNLDNPPFRRDHPHSPSTSFHLPTTNKSFESYPHPSSAEDQATATNVHLEPTSHQANDTCSKRNTLCAELQEPKIIGGFTYFVRNSHCMPKSANHQISSQSKQKMTLSISH